MIAEVLGKPENQDVDLGDLSAVAVTIGPGTFTGIRIGLATARAIALPKQLPVVGITTFDAIFFQAPKIKGSMLAALETKREDFYVQFSQVKEEALLPPMALLGREILKLLPADPITLIGDGAERLNRLLVKCGRQPSRLFGDIKPLASEFAELAFNRSDSGVYCDPEPLYLRAPSVSVPTRQ